MQDISLVICGQAGQGIQTVEEFLVSIIKMSGYHVYATKEYMSRVRGGMNSTELRISSQRVCAFVDKIDILVSLDIGAVKHLQHRIGENTYFIGDPSSINTDLVPNRRKIFEFEFNTKAKEIGNKIYSNVIAVGVIAGLLHCDKNFAEEYINDRFKDKGKNVVEKNIDSFHEGYIKGKELLKQQELDLNLEKTDTVVEEILFNGNQSIGLGAIAGGCNFISAYPMSPSTGTLIFLAQHSHEFNIIIDQAEDEIAAINKGIGSWYAGGRPMVSTSGGGFALMVEGFSLAGMIESPLVIHLAQRPGPATGLPTRTGQEDLNFVIHAAHGEFPRIVYAPGTIQQAFSLTQKAFNLSDRLQVPIIILTDQYFVDTYYNIPNLNVSRIQVEHHFIESDEDYMRYKYTNDGISPRAIPGYGIGLVRVDSDEHDEHGHITEDLMGTRKKMIEKRVHKKMEKVQENIIKPELVTMNTTGDYEFLVICWGSNYHVVKEAIEKIDDPNIAMLHFSQVYPISTSVKETLNKASSLLVLENNETGQFSDVIHIQIGIEIPNEKRILKSNGAPFSVEEVIKEIRDRIETTSGGGS
ncbi:MAG: 2-oxoacid:acceptor oxidoreductase subunit alpha [Candidatus Lokiarchaeota archaeon]|nr:2-oxoacid:acceptor oxidoreductase subunit alpha [Candidatus Lokiarchaeota archaeon]